MDRLRNLDCVEVIDDTFGPTVDRKTDKLFEWFHTNPQDDPIVRKYLTIDNEEWLVDTIRNVNRIYGDLGIEDTDFSEESTEAQWEPIPLNRNDNELRLATEKLDEAIIKIEQDNGYAATIPGEREYVLQNLKQASKILREYPQIYVMQLKVFVFEPLSLVVKRFGGAAVGISAIAARQAITEWLRGNFVHVLDKLTWPF